MPRVNTQVKSPRGRERTCNRCGRKIEPGETYYTWAFRYGGPRFACREHYPRPSELTQSLMSGVYSAIEDAEDGMASAESIEEVRELVDAVAESATEVAEQYREAAEPFGGAGENADRADELEGWASELESFSPDEPEDTTDELRDQIEDEMRAEGLDEDDEGEWISVLEARLLQAEEDNEPARAALDEALETARTQAQDLLSSCPL